jgi:hypothetical protein
MLGRKMLPKTTYLERRHQLQAETGDTRRELSFVNRLGREEDVGQTYVHLSQTTSNSKYHPDWVKSEYLNYNGRRLFASQHFCNTRPMWEFY